MKKNRIMVIGHKNPDTDSICSAISYANLKNKVETGKFKYVPCRAGQVNSETKYVLERFGMELPEYVPDVRTRAEDIEMHKIEGVESGISVKRAWTLMRDLNVSTLSVTQGKKLEGIISVKDIATANMDIYDNTILSKSGTDYGNIIETLGATMVVGSVDDVVEKGKILIAAANPDVLEGFVDEGDIVILGDRYDNQLCAIEMGAGCLVVCVNTTVTATIKKLATERGCKIICTPYDTYTAARLISQSTPIRYFMRSKELVTFKNDAFTDDIMTVMAKVRHRDFPVVDNAGNYKGMISRRSLMDLDKKKLILVDHNEKSQAVDGFDEAEILEIIDHHRIGSIETLSPVYFRNQPVGCTATIVYQMYIENDVEIEPHIAGLLCAAIISDTLMFRSPTCTPADKAAATSLAKKAKIKIPEFAEEMFEAGSNLSEKSPEEIFYQDYKKFTAGELTFGVGQISSMNSSVFEKIKPELVSYIERSYTSQGVNMIYFMLTNILDESTELLVLGFDAETYAEKAFNIKAEGNSLKLKGVVSRKKQLIPKLINAIKSS